MEIGCGNFPYVKGENVTYLDRMNVNLPNVVVWNLNILPLPFPENSYDRIVARHVLEHCIELYPIFDELHRILKPTGSLFVEVPHEEGRWMEGPCADELHFFKEGTFKLLERDGIRFKFLKPWKIAYLQTTSYVNITERGKIIKSVRLRRLAWTLLHWKKRGLRKKNIIQCELIPLKEIST